MFQYRDVLILSTIVTVFPMFILNQMQQYDDQEGSHKGTINTSFFVENFEGIVLYAMNKYERLVIKFEKKENVKNYLLLKSVNYSQSCDMEILCGGRDCDVKHLVFVANLRGSKISINCNGKANNITMIRSDLPNILSQYPGNRYISNINETLIWMRDVGPYIPINGPYYYKVHSTLKGCLEYFYFNGENVESDSKNRKHLLPSCKKSFNGTICNWSDCWTNTISIDVADCFSLMVDEKLCLRAREIPIYTPSNTSYIKRNETTVPVHIQIKWQTLSENNYCLAGIDYRDGSSMVLSNDGTDNIILQSVKDATESDVSVIIKNITKVVMNVLSIEFTNNELIIRMTSQRVIYTFIGNLSSQPIMITFGYSKYNNKCIDFSGFLDFQYDPRQFRRYENSSIIHVKTTHSFVWMIPFTICIAITSGILLALALFYWLLNSQSFPNKRLIPSNKRRLSGDILNISLPILEDNHYISIQDDY